MFVSTFRELWDHSPITFPDFTGTRIMMMPVTLGSLYGVPSRYMPLVSKLYGPWFEGYTKNPYGVQPTGPILPRRDEYMS